MKAAVFFEGYLPYHEVKDPGLIPLGLNRIGCDTCLVTLRKPELTHHTPSFPLIAAERGILYSARFWKDLDADTIICYTWLQPSYNPILEKMITGGKKIIIKSDLDGRVGYPVTPRYVDNWQLKPLQRLWGRVYYSNAYG